MTEATATPFGHTVVAGAGSWGTALAILLANADRGVTLWARTHEAAAAMEARRENARHLPGLPLPRRLSVTAGTEILAGADALLMAIPAQHAREHLATFRDAAKSAAMPVLLCAKGIEQSTGMFVHEVLAEVWPEAIPAILSGPSFAADVARGKPTAVTLAADEEDVAQRWAATLATPSFRPYHSTDLLGVALGGAAKNVLAIGCGVVAGRGLGESARAALIARGFAELLRLADAYGADPDTLHGLSGLGDMILTCGSTQSRNYSLGLAIGEGQSVGDVMAGRRSVAEGAATARILVDLAKKKSVEMPVASAVADLVEGKLTVDAVTNSLLSRPLRAE